MPSYSHDLHDISWSILNRDGNNVCVACLVQVCEESTFRIEKLRTLQEFLGLIRYDSEAIIHLFSNDLRVTGHLIDVFLNLLAETDEGISGTVIAIIADLLCLLKLSDPVCYLLQRIEEVCTNAQTYTQIAPYLQLTAKLFESVPSACLQVLQYHRKLVEFACTGVEQQDASHQATACLLLIRLCQSHDRHVLPAQCTRQVANGLLAILTGCQATEDLLVTALGLMKTMLADEEVISVFITPSPRGGHVTLAAAVKRCLQCRHDSVRIAVTQCLAVVVNSRFAVDYVIVLLNYDVTEFLFEVLNTTNDLLIGGVFCCLMGFASCSDFFLKSHATYGFDVTLRAMDLLLKAGNTPVAIHGYRYVMLLLTKCPDRVRLITTTKTLVDCLAVLHVAAEHSDDTVTWLGAQSLTGLLRTSVLPSPVPFKQLSSVLVALGVKAEAACKLVDSGAVMGPIKRRPRRHLARHVTTVRLFVNLLARAWRLEAMTANDPASDSATFAVPSSSADSTFSHHIFITDLSHLLLTVALPVFMACYKHIDDSGSYRDIFDCLNAWYASHRDDVDVLYTTSSKFVQAGLLHFSLHTSRTLRDVHKEAILVVSHMTTSCLKHEGWTEQQLSTVAESLSQMSGTLQDELSIAGDDSIQLTHISAVSLLYVAALHNERLLSTNQLRGSLQRFLQHFGHKLHLVTSLPVLRMTVFLAAFCFDQADAGAADNSDMEGILLNAMGQCSEPCIWYTHNALLLNWCFSNSTLSACIGTAMVQCALSASESITQTLPVSETLVTLSKTNPLFVMASVDALAQPSELAVVDKLLHLLRLSLATNVARDKESIDDNCYGDEGQCNEIVETLSCSIPQLLHTLLLNADQDENEEAHIRCLCGVLDIASLLTQQQKTYDTMLQNVKIVHLVRKRLHSGKARRALTVSFLRFITLVLVQSIQQRNTAVGEQLLQDIDWLQELNSRDMWTSVLPLLTCLMHIHSIILPQAEQGDGERQVHVAVEDVDEALSWRRPVSLMVVLLTTWSVYLNTLSITRSPGNRLRPLLVIYRRQRDDQLLTDLDSRLHPLCTSDLRSLMLHVQQLAIVENTRLREASFWCLRQIFLTLTSAGCGDMVINQPWNTFLLRAVFSRFQDSMNVGPCLLLFFETVLSVCPRLYTQEQLQILVKYCLANTNACHGRLISSLIKVIRSQCKNLENLADKLQTTLDAAANPNSANDLHLLWTDHIKGVCLENIESMKPSC